MLRPLTLSLLLPAFGAVAEPVGFAGLLSEAKAISAIGASTVIVVTENGGYICELNIHPSYFKQLANGVKTSPGFQPTSFCFPAENVKEMGQF